MAKKKTKKKKAATKKTTKKVAKKTVAKKPSAKPARRGLSRGLGALLSSSRPSKEKAVEKPVTVSVNPAQVLSPADKNETKPVNGELTSLPIEQLQRGRYQPRQSIKQEPLQELAASIKQQGIMQPIVVREISKVKYEIIAGERRWRAAQLAMLQDVPVIVRNIADEDAIAMALIENIQRENLNAVDEATALHRLIEEFELTHDEAAQAIGRSRVSVSNLLRLLELEPSVRKMLEIDEIAMGHARALLSLPPMKQLAAAKEVAKKGLSVRATEALVRGLLGPKKPKLKSARSKNTDIQRLEHDLTDKLGARVSIDDKKGKGKLIIEYSSLDELDGILEKIG